MKLRISPLFVCAVLAWTSLVLGADETDQPQPTGKSTATDVATPGEPPTEPTFLLRYKFHAGQLLRWKIEHLVTVKTKIQGTIQKAETRSLSTKAWRVISVNSEGEAVYAHMVEDVDMWQKVTGRQEIRYNSKTDDKPPPDYVNAAAAVGVTLSTITLSAKGTVIERNNRRGMPDSKNAPVTMPLPERSVKIADKWDQPYGIPVRKHDGTLIHIQARQVFQLDKVVAGLATISLKSEVLTPVNDPRIEAQLVQRLLNGTIKFDIDAGRVQRQRMASKASVLAFSGADSSMDYKARFTEDFLSVDVEAVAEPATQADSADKEPRKPLRTVERRRKSARIRR